MDDDPQGLRARAVRLFAMAIHIREDQPAYAEKLVAEAIELQDRATAIEDAAHTRPPSESPQPVQLQEQVPPRKEGE
jgi:hypothetical protein